MAMIAKTFCHFSCNNLTVLTLIKGESIVLKDGRRIGYGIHGDPNGKNALFLFHGTFYFFPSYIT
jgi:hypothetical protein